MTVEKDESINKREVIVSFKAFQVFDMIAEAALTDAGMAMLPGTTVEVDCKLTCKDSLSYERKTEGLAEGARVKIVVDRDYKAPEQPKMDPVDFGISAEAKPEPEFKDNGRDHPEPKRDRSGRIKD